MKILICQIEIPLFKERKEQLLFIDQIIDKALIHKNDNPGIQFIVFPELLCIDYSREAFYHLDELSEDTSGQIHSKFRALAKKANTYISFSYPRKKNNSFYISNTIISNNGSVISKYDKLHIAQFGASMEKEFFCSGNQLSVFSIGDFKFGVIICYDFRFSELIQTLVYKHNVNVIIHPVAFYKDGTYPAWHHFALVRAIEYQIYFLSVNRAGKNYGHSILCKPWLDNDIQPETFGDAETFQIFELKKELISEIRNEYQFRNDRRGDYQKLSL